MKLKWGKKSFIGLIGLLILSVAIAGCGDSKKSDSSDKVKLKVAIWDRGNVPGGQTFNDNVLVNWINQEVASLGIEIEYVPYPRAQEEEKLNTWMASGEAPDIIQTYNYGLMNKFAEQGGLHPLEEYVEKYGDNIKTANAEAMALVGTYNGHRYGIPAMRPNPGGPTMKVRQDWLDKLGMEAPTTTDELYELLKAFKEQDPGGVGSDNVVPYALPALTQGMKGFLYGIAYGFGVRYDSPDYLVRLPGGNFENGEFKSNILTPQGKEFLQFMNRLYSEGLVSKEFVTDLNSQNYIKHISSGTAGFADSNERASDYTEMSRQSVPDARWVEIEPFKDPSGKQLMIANPRSGMVNLVPKTSGNPEAAVQFLNWMADPKTTEVLKYGFEDRHYKLEDGLHVTTDVEKKKQDIDWISGDLLIMGSVDALTPEQVLKTAKDQETGESINRLIELIQTYGEPAPIPDIDMPYAQKNSGVLVKYLSDNISKVIVAKDFDKAYAELVEGWNGAGGAEYDREVTAFLQGRNK